MQGRTTRCSRQRRTIFTRTLHCFPRCEHRTAGSLITR
jgi:hypothetical protein